MTGFDLCCAFEKMDVPALRTLVQMLTDLLQQHWTPLAQDALNQAQIELARAEKKDDDFYFWLLALLESKLEAPPSGHIISSIVGAANVAFSEGSRNTVRLKDHATALGDMLLLLKGRFRNRMEHIGMLLRLPDPAQRLALLRAEFGVEARNWLTRVVDLWAYRWFALGRFRGAESQGLVYWNPLDYRTTPFCNWLAGQAVDEAKVNRRYDQLKNAIVNDDLEGMFVAWPMVSPKRTNNEADFAAIRDEVALPPFHWYCRTEIISK